jgi:hypothetical protein
MDDYDVIIEDSEFSPPDVTHGKAANETGKSSSSGKKTQKPSLPASCDPPGPGNPPQQMVWVVSRPGTHVTSVFGVEISKE